MLVIAYLIIVSIFVDDAVLGEVRGIGLFYPDLGALRQIIGPNDMCNVTEKNTKDTILKCWKSLSEKSREFLLKENDIAIVIVQHDGTWLYRTSGVHTLKPVHASNEEKIPSDMNNLLEIIRTPAYQKLKDLHQESLFSSNIANYSARLGSYILEVEKVQPMALKDWLLSIIGSHLYHMDPISLAKLSENEKYRNKFSGLIGLARKNIYKNAVLASTKSKIPDGTLVQATKGISAKKFAGLLVLQPDQQWDYWRIQDKWVAGKPASGGSLYVTSDDQVEFSKAIDSENFANKGVKVYFGAPGRKEVSRVEYSPEIY